MKRLFYWSGLAFTIVGSTCIHFEYYASALYWSLAGIGIWLYGVCDAIKTKP